MLSLLFPALSANQGCQTAEHACKSLHVCMYTYIRNFMCDWLNETIEENGNAVGKTMAEPWVVATQLQQKE